MSASHAPNEFARVAIDFCALAGAAARKQDVAIGIDIQRIHVGEIKTAPGQINKRLLVADIEIIPGAPLEDQIAGGSKLLNDLLGH